MKPQQQRRCRARARARRPLARARAADVLPVAREQGALVRRRQVRAAADLPRLVLVSAVGELSLRLTAAWAMVAGVTALSDVALLWRLRRCLPWLRTLVTARLAAGGVDLPAAAGRRLRMIDGSAISGPGSAGTDWRVHLDYDPVEQRLTAIAVTDAHGGESLTRCTFAKDDIAVADRGYCRARGIAHVLDHDADVVVRLNIGALPLFAAADTARPLDLAAWLATAPVGITVPAADQPARWLPLRLIARCLDRTAANAARRRVRQQATKRGPPRPRSACRSPGSCSCSPRSTKGSGLPRTCSLAIASAGRSNWSANAGKDCSAWTACAPRTTPSPQSVSWSALLTPLFASEATDSARPCSRWRCFAAWVAHARQARPLRVGAATSPWPLGSRRCRTSNATSATPPAAVPAKPPKHTLSSASRPEPTMPQATLRAYAAAAPV